jgi:hypothetical protein
MLTTFKVLVIILPRFSKFYKQLKRVMQRLSPNVAEAVGIYVDRPNCWQRFVGIPYLVIKKYSFKRNCAIAQVLFTYICFIAQNTENVEASWHCCCLCSHSWDSRYHCNCCCNASSYRLVKLNRYFCILRLLSNYDLCF